MAIPPTRLGDRRMPSSTGRSGAKARSFPESSNTPNAGGSSTTWSASTPSERRWSSRPAWCRLLRPSVPGVAGGACLPQQVPAALVPARSQSGLRADPARGARFRRPRVRPVPRRGQAGHEALERGCPDGARPRRVGRAVGRLSGTGDHPRRADDHRTGVLGRESDPGRQNAVLLGHPQGDDGRRLAVFRRDGPHRARRTGRRVGRGAAGQRRDARPVGRRERHHARRVEARRAGGGPLMEVAARTPGDGIMVLYRLATGRRMEPEILRIALGEPADYPAARRYARQVYVGHRPGILGDVEVDWPGVEARWVDDGNPWPDIPALPADDPPALRAVLVYEARGAELGPIRSSDDRAVTFFIDAPDDRRAGRHRGARSPGRDDPHDPILRTELAVTRATFSAEVRRTLVRRTSASSRRMAGCGSPRGASNGPGSYPADRKTCPIDRRILAPPAITRARQNHDHLSHD